MTEVNETTFTAFQDQRRLASGSLRDVIAAAKTSIDVSSQTPIIIFDDNTGRTVEVDFRGTTDQVLARVGVHASESRAADPERERRPGRPKLGVVAREVTLLPRHWEWLNRQPGGASVALRKLVEEARRSHQARDRARQSQEAVNRCMTIMAGDLPGYEEASRAFYRGDRQRFDQLTASWPPDVRDYLRKLVDRATSDRADAQAEEASRV
ncbi:MAG TPA: DUF2239 family protein [Terriglobales bacterium]|nr:DUF2239 family protein [Terriglobales bacterium]